MDLVLPRNTRFECQRCARCCGDTSHRGRNLLLTREEVERISSRTRTSPLSFSSSISKNGQYRYKMKKRGGKCVFLDGKSCRIYNTRPIVCKFYPFSMCKNKGDIVFDVSEDCPGVGLGEVLPCDGFRNLVSEAQLRSKTV